jgi:hypothetical protein
MPSRKAQKAIIEQRKLNPVLDSLWLKTGHFKWFIA